MKQTYHVALNFGLLALETSVHPVVDVNVHEWPQVSRSDEVLSRTDARVRQGIQGIVDAAAK